MSDDYEEKYTKPDLRRELKEEIMEGDRGGRPGQWSARKAQLLVNEYEQRGGGYKKDEKDADAKSLEEWTDQDWQTADGSAYAEDGERMKRYLPKDAWDLLSEDEKERAKKKKRDGDSDGQQFVENTAAAKAARAFVDHGDASELTEEQLERLSKDELMDLAQEADIEGRSSMNKGELSTAIRRHHESSLENKTKRELYELAKDEEIEGRSEMSKSELQSALEDE